MDEIKRTMNVPATLQSCHTAVVGKYVIEGHVPADAIKKFLAEKPTALGLAAPGMPMGSPGMEGDRVDHLRRHRVRSRWQDAGLRKALTASPTAYKSLAGVLLARLIEAA